LPAYETPRHHWSFGFSEEKADEDQTTKMPYPQMSPEGE
jgi:hypothetical protein